jgi:hypothetical protein
MNQMEIMNGGHRKMFYDVKEQTITVIIRKSLGSNLSSKARYSQFLHFNGGTYLKKVIFELHN